MAMGEKDGWTCQERANRPNVHRAVNGMTLAGFAKNANGISIAIGYSPVWIATANAMQLATSLPTAINYA